MDLFYDHIALAVTDIDRSIAFYHGVMGLTGGKRHFQKDGREQAIFGVGEGILVLFHLPRYEPKKRSPRSGMHHLAFGLDPKDYDAIVKRCEEQDVRIERAAINSGAKGKGLATYFYDPDGNEIEIKKYVEDPNFRELEAEGYEI